MRRLPPIVFVVLASSTLACGVSKGVHCKFVSDVDTASAHYKDAATLASNAGWEAEADELKKTVDSEKAAYCK
jgi:hypothetical protein